MASAYSGGATNFVLVSYNGYTYNNNASNANRAPICFQRFIPARPSKPTWAESRADVFVWKEDLTLPRECG